MLLAASILGITNNLDLAAKKLPTVFFTEPEYVLLENGKDIDLETLYHHDTNLLDIADIRHLLEVSQEEWNNAQSQEALFCRFYFMTDMGKEEIKDKDFNSTIIKLKIYNYQKETPNLEQTRSVRVLYPKSIEVSHDSEVENVVNSCIAGLQLDGATTENIHDALNASIQ
jgi:hypothetical protein